MQVKELMTPRPEYLEVDGSIREAAIRMLEEERGFVPISEKEKLVGVLTDRDIAVRAMADGKDPNAKVSTIMSGKVLYCYQEDDITDVLQNMTQMNVQRLIVLNNDKNKDFVGVVSLSDIADSCGEKDVDLMRRVVYCCRHYH